MLRQGINWAGKEKLFFGTENTFMMCPNFIWLILQVLKDLKVSKSLINQELLACFLNSYSYCDRHSDHGVVTCTDQTHHLFAVDAFGELQSGETF